MARKLLWKFFRKFGYTSRGCSLFWKFWEMRPEFVFFDYEIFATVLRNECYSARSTGQIIANILSSPSDNRLLAFGKVGKVHWRVNSRFLPVANFPALTTRQMFPRLATEISHKSLRSLPCKHFQGFVTSSTCGGHGLFDGHHVFCLCRRRLNLRYINGLDECVGRLQRRLHVLR